MPRCLCRRRPRLLPRRMMALLLLPRRPLAMMACGNGTGTAGTPPSTTRAWTPTATSKASGSTARVSTPMTQLFGTTSRLMHTISCSSSRPRAEDMAKARRARHQDPTMDTQRGQDQLEAAKPNGQLRSLLVRLELLAAQWRGTRQRLPRLPSRQYQRRDQLNGKITGAGEVDGIREMEIGGDEDPQRRHPHGPAVAAPVQEEERLCGLRAGLRGGGDRRVPSAHRTITGLEFFRLLQVVLYVQRCACVGLMGSYGPRRGGSKSTPLRLIILYPLLLPILT